MIWCHVKVFHNNQFMFFVFLASIAVSWMLWQMTRVHLDINGEISRTEVNLKVFFYKNKLFLCGRYRDWLERLK